MFTKIGGGAPHAHRDEIEALRALALVVESDVIDDAEQARALNPTFDCTLWMLIAASAHLGRMDEARYFLNELRALAPDVTVASIRAGQAAKDPSRIAPILDGLRLAGLPEE